MADKEEKKTDWSKYPMASFRPSAALLERASGNVGNTAKRDLDRYYDALEHHLPKFSQDEAVLLCDALNDVMCTPDTLWANVAYACEDRHLATTWSVDQQELLNRIHSLSYIEAQALIDAVERAWNDPDGYSVNLKQRVLLVGLVNPS